MTRWVELLAALVVMSWTWSAAAILLTSLFGWDAPAFARVVFAELRPFYLPAVAAGVVIDAASGMGWWDRFAVVVNLLNWFVLKDLGGDDRWKRRARNLAEKVSRVGSRLTVSPAGAS